MNDDDANALRAQIAGMADDDLVELDARWEAYAAGTLPADEVEALLRAAESSELDTVAQLALAPLDDVVHGRITEFAATHYRKVAETPEASPWRAWWFGIAALFAGAVAALVLVPRTPGDIEDYEAIWRSGEQDVRSTPVTQDVPTFTAGSRIQLDLRPASTPDNDPVTIVAIDDWDRRVDVTPVTTPYGVLRLEGTMGTPPWDLPPGQYTLLVTLGPTGARHGPGAPPEDWQTFSLPFVIAR